MIIKKCGLNNIKDLSKEQLETLKDRTIVGFATPEKRSL